MAKFEFKEKNIAYEIAVYIIMFLIIIFTLFILAALLKFSWIILFRV